MKNGNKWINKILIKYHGEEWFYENSMIVDISSIVFFIALICPVIYFFYDLLNRKNINLISILGFINILLTGGIGIFGAKFGLSKNWFIFKEGLLPIIIGLILIVQIVLGILTLLSGAQMIVSSMHQISSIFLVSSSIYLVYLNLNTNLQLSD